MNITSKASLARDSGNCHRTWLNEEPCSQQHARQSTSPKRPAYATLQSTFPLTRFAALTSLPRPVFCSPQSVSRRGWGLLRFDAALAAQDTLREARAEPGADWDDRPGSDIFLQCRRHGERPTSNSLRWPPAPTAHRSQAFCLYHATGAGRKPLHGIFRPAMTLAEAYLASPEEKDPARESRHGTAGSFRTGLGLDEEDDIVVEFRRIPQRRRLRRET